MKNYNLFFKIGIFSILISCSSKKHILTVRDKVAKKEIQKINAEIFNTNIKILDNKEYEKKKLNKELSIKRDEISILSLYNTKWDFENYTNNTIDIFDYKKPQLSIKFTDNKNMVVYGTLFFNHFDCNFLLSDKKILKLTNFKISNNPISNNILKKIEDDFVENFKKVNSYKVYKDYLIFLVDDTSNESMVFKKAVIKIDYKKR